MSFKRQLLGMVLVPAAVSLFGCGSTETKSNGTGGSGSSNTGGASNTGGTSSSTGGTSSTTGGMVAEVSSVAELCTVFPAAFGDFMARCHGGDAGEWASLVEEPCAPTARSEIAGRVELDSDNTETCLELLAGTDCSFYVLDGAGPCSNMVKGTIAAEAACDRLRFGDECEPGSYCEFHNSCGGSCRPYYGEGTHCHGNLVTGNCLPGLECDGPSAVCFVPGAEGEPCAGEDRRCVVGTYCDTEDATDTGTCRPGKTEAPCRFEWECAADFNCVLDDSGAGRCVQAKPVGAACSVGRGECAGSCSADGICQVFAGKGEPCGFVGESSGEYVSCGPGLFCNEEPEGGRQGTCRELLPLGAACPEPWESRGNPCEEDDEPAHCDADLNQCVTCNVD